MVLTKNHWSDLRLRLVWNLLHGRSSDWKFYYFEDRILLFRKINIFSWEIMSVSTFITDIILYLSMICTFPLWSLQAIIKQLSWYEHNIMFFFVMWWYTVSSHQILYKHSIVDMFYLKSTSHHISLLRLSLHLQYEITLRNLFTQNKSMICLLLQPIK